MVSINSNISMFSMADFIKEFSDKILYGFVFAAEIHTFMALEANRGCLDKQCRWRINYGKVEIMNLYFSFREMTAAKYEKYMLALIRDVLVFLMKANATLT